jgi:hypothetical protein
MQRRKFLATVGSLAAGSAAAIGTGAFNMANVNRGVSVNMADDAAAFLALEDTSTYADGSGDKLVLTFDDDAQVIGDGINRDSDYSFTGVFAIRNQGNQPVGVWITENAGNADAAGWYGVATDDTSDFGTSIEGPGNAYSLDVGDRVYVNVVLLNQDPIQPSDLPTEITVGADASQG